MRAALVHHALEQAAALYGDGDAVWEADQRWSYRRPDVLESTEQLVS